MIDINRNARNLNESHELSEHIRLSVKDFSVTVSNQLDNMSSVTEFDNVIPIYCFYVAWVISLKEGGCLVQIWLLNHEEDQEHGQMHN